MRCLKLISPLCGLALLALAQPALAQRAPADSSLLVTTATQVLAQRYTRSLGTDLRLYNGPEYVSYVRRDTQGHRFFGPDSAQVATVKYAGHTYAGVPLRYDLVRQQLVLQAPVGALQMRLLNEQVAFFELGGHRFIRLVVDSSAGAGVSTGYYDLLVDGPARLLAARRKSLQERSTATGILSEISASEKYFVSQNRRYYSVSTAATVLRLFPAQKAALRQFIKANQLKFGAKTREPALVALLRYQATLAAAPPAN